MNIDHAAGALLAGLFLSSHPSDRRRFDRTADGTVMVEFEVQTAESSGNRRVTTRHPAIAYGPLAVRIATTFTPGDLVVVSGEIGAVPGHRLPIALVNVRNAFRVSEHALLDNAPTVNVAYAVGTARDAAETKLCDGTAATVLTVACLSQPPGHNRNHHTVILEGSMRDHARSVAAGDTIRVDGRIGLHAIGRQNVWALTCANLSVLERCPERSPLMSPMSRSLQPTG